MAEFFLDGSSIESREQFWDAYLRAVRPEGGEMFGRNLDALNDALRGGPGWPGFDFMLRIFNSSALRRSLGDDFIDRLIDVFDDNARYATLSLE